MTTVYKLTNQQGYTRNGYSNRTKWGEGVSHRAEGTGGLCTAGCIHAYTTPELAILLNPLHANISNPLIFEGEMDITHRDKSDLKVGGRFLTTTRQLKLPEISMRQRVIFALLCADAAIDMSVKHMPPRALKKLAEWRQWRDDYISGKTSEYAARGRAKDMILSAAYAANAAAYAARADLSAAYAANAAAYAARAALSAGYAELSAAYAADAAANAAARAAKTPALDLAELARRAIELGR